MILPPLQKLPKNGEDWGKLIVAKGFKKLPKVQNIAKSGHTVDLVLLKFSKTREMEYIERALFIEIFWSLISLARFMTFTIL